MFCSSDRTSCYDHPRQIPLLHNGVLPHYSQSTTRSHSSCLQSVRPTTGFGWNKLSTSSQGRRAGSRKCVDSTFRTESLLSIPLPPPTEDFIIGQSRSPVSRVDKLAGPIMNAGESILLRDYTHNGDCDSIICPSPNLPTLRCVAERMKSENHLGRLDFRENILQRRGFSLESNPDSRPLTSVLNGKCKPGGNAASCFSSEKRSPTQISCKSIPTPTGLSESHPTAPVKPTGGDFSAPRLDTLSVPKATPLTTSPAGSTMLRTMLDASGYDGPFQRSHESDLLSKPEWSSLPSSKRSGASIPRHDHSITKLLPIAEGCHESFVRLNSTAKAEPYCTPPRVEPPPFQVQHQAQDKCIQTDDHLLRFSRQTSPAGYRPPSTYSIFGALEDVLDFASALLPFRKRRQYYPSSDFLSPGVMGKVIQTGRSFSKSPMKRSSLRRRKRLSIRRSRY
ncbi:hypothetical protein T265_02766 [Opisthorchis viverrini]|uniref:Uncharacterized protein n=1 Tax=Opisthorchis viverrini TaxID=6198 RepID=A0A074ZTZ9_OPIVI|nr:hypothetical protein T265_02766 [Opisthorchis viverrini]KER30958.1 hypothetical protein T265_02766 [Opisthorchis viverrini]